MDGEENDMGVYIPNMEKPTQCYDCRLISSDGLYCRMTHNNVDWSKVNSDCPLIEIDLVRCGECKHYVREVCQLDPFWERYTEPNDFCSQGERRADE